MRTFAIADLNRVNCMCKAGLTFCTGLCGVSEREKWELKEKKLVETICYRDGRIEEIQRQRSQQSDEITQLVARFYFHWSLTQAVHTDTHASYLPNFAVVGSRL